MQIEEHLTDADLWRGTPYYFTAVLFEDYDFWMPGPSGHTRARVLEDLALYQCVQRVVLTKTYVPHVQ